MIKKAPQKPRSPTTGKVFEAFVAELRDDPLIGEAVAGRVGAALSPGQSINAVNLQEAFFPVEEADAD